MKKRFFATIALFIFSFGFYLPQAHACSCLQPGSALEEMGKSNAVFSGQVKETRFKEERIEVNFEVYEVWQGEMGPTVTFTTASDSAACGYPFVDGEEYLIYAGEYSGEFAVNLCSRTMLLTDAEEDLQALGEGYSMEGYPSPIKDQPFFWILISVGFITVVYLVVRKV